LRTVNSSPWDVSLVGPALLSVQYITMNVSEFPCVPPLLSKFTRFILAEPVQLSVLPDLQVQLSVVHLVYYCCFLLRFCTVPLIPAELSSSSYTLLYQLVQLPVLSYFTILSLSTPSVQFSTLYSTMCYCSFLHALLHRCTLL
jgi:hypothetical protein